jgi:hypothetical protein
LVFGARITPGRALRQAARYAWPYVSLSRVGRHQMRTSACHSPSHRNSSSLRLGSPTPSPHDHDPVSIEFRGRSALMSRCEYCTVGSTNNFTNKPDLVILAPAQTSVSSLRPMTHTSRVDVSRPGRNMGATFIRAQGVSTVARILLPI